MTINSILVLSTALAVVMSVSCSNGDEITPSFHADGEDYTLERQIATEGGEIPQSLLLFSKPTIMRRLGVANKVEDLAARLYWLELRRRDQPNSRLLWHYTVQADPLLLPRSFVLSVQKPRVVGLAFVDSLRLSLKQISLGEHIKEYQVPSPDEVARSLGQQKRSNRLEGSKDSVFLADLIHPRPSGSFHSLPKQIDSLQRRDDAWKINVTVGSDRFAITNRNKEWTLQRGSNNGTNDCSQAEKTFQEP